ncbi:ankyrin repeat-containing domain protein [Paraphoma chrysanthemicola]|nr:ankyrin repeat-containing domain protein [Paraphoma chrysanthemicola]
MTRLISAGIDLQTFMLQSTQRANLSSTYFSLAQLKSTENSNCGVLATFHGDLKLSLGSVADQTQGGERNDDRRTSIDADIHLTPTMRHALACLSLVPFRTLDSAFGPRIHAAIFGFVSRLATCDAHHGRSSQHRKPVIAGLYELHTDLGTVVSVTESIHELFKVPRFVESVHEVQSESNVDILGGLARALQSCSREASKLRIILDDLGIGTHDGRYERTKMQWRMDRRAHDIERLKSNFQGHRSSIQLSFQLLATLRAERDVRELQLQIADLHQVMQQSSQHINNQAVSPGDEEQTQIIDEMRTIHNTSEGLKRRATSRLEHLTMLSEHADGRESELDGNPPVVAEVREMEIESPAPAILLRVKPSPDGQNVVVNSGSVKLIDWLIERGAEPGVQNIHGQTPLHVALLHEQVGVSKSLLSTYSSCMINLKDDQGCTPLHIACALYLPSDVVQDLIVAGATVDTRDRFDVTSFQRAGTEIKTVVKEHTREEPFTELPRLPSRTDFRNRTLPPYPGHQYYDWLIEQKLKESPSNLSLQEVMTEILKILADAGFKGSKSYRRVPNKALRWVIEDQDSKRSIRHVKKIMEVLLNCGANIDTISQKLECGLLSIAAKNQNLHLIKFLLGKGATVDLRPEGSCKTPLYSALLGDRALSAQMLLRAGANVNVLIPNNGTLLHEAISDHQRIEWHLPLLLAHGSSTDCKDARGRTPLDLAIESDCIDATRALLGSGADVHGDCTEIASIPEHVWTCALFMAVARGHGEVVRLLVEEYFADEDATKLSSLGRGLLHYLACSPPGTLDDTVDMLFGLRLEVNAEDNDRDTPLHVAAREGNSSIAKKLLEHGATTHPQNRKGETPLDLAKARRHREVVECLGGTYKKKWWRSK